MFAWVLTYIFNTYLIKRNFNVQKYVTYQIYNIYIFLSINTEFFVSILNKYKSALFFVLLFTSNFKY